MPLPEWQWALFLDCLVTFYTFYQTAETSQSGLFPHSSVEMIWFKCLPKTKKEKALNGFGALGFEALRGWT